MLDTIVLKIPLNLCKIVKPELFTPDLVIRKESEADESKLRKDHKLFMKYIQNPTSEDKENGIYKPCLTLYRDNRDMKIFYNLHIQFSVGKLLSKNNLGEHRDICMFEAVPALEKVLRTMGVEVSQDVLLDEAKVTKMHIGKNIELPYPYSVTEVVNHLKKLDTNKKNDMTKRDYKNGGESLHFYHGSRNIVFYDKLKDMQKNKNVSTDKDKMWFEAVIAENLEKHKKQVLRIEARYTDQKLVRKMVNKFLCEDYEVITLRVIFDEILWKNALLHEWDTILDNPGNQLVLKMEVSPFELFHKLLAQQSIEKPTSSSINKLFITLGIYFSANAIGIKELKNLLLLKWSNKAVSERLLEKFESALDDLKDIDYHESIEIIQKALNDFEYYKVDYTGLP